MAQLQCGFSSQSEVQTSNSGAHRRVSCDNGVVLHYGSSLTTELVSKPRGNKPSAPGRAGVRGPGRLLPTGKHEEPESIHPALCLLRRQQALASLRRMPSSQFRLHRCLHRCRRPPDRPPDPSPSLARATHHREQFPPVLVEIPPGPGLRLLSLRFGCCKV